MMARSLVFASFAAVFLFDSARGVRTGVFGKSSVPPKGFFDGQLRRLQLFPDDWCTTPQNGTRSKAKVCADGRLKARRPMPHVTVSELIQMVKESKPGAVLPGPLNGWRSMVDLQLQTVTCKAARNNAYLWRYTDATASESSEAIAEQILAALSPKSLASKCSNPLSIRARAVGARWSKIGWSDASPGFVFAFRSQAEPPKMVFGEDLAREGGMERAERVHLFAHRYAKEEENYKDKLTWHAGLLIEWDHGRYTTVVELAWLNGLGGYGGMSNWYADKLSGDTALFKAMPDAMKQPWDSSRSEIRMLDIPSNNVTAFSEFLEIYSNRTGYGDRRFLEAKFPASSGSVSIYRNTRADISRYILNYVRADGGYSEINRNCQTFAADLFHFLTGESMSVFTTVMKLAYRDKTQQFTQEPHRQTSKVQKLKVE